MSYASNQILNYTGLFLLASIGVFVALFSTKVNFSHNECTSRKFDEALSNLVILAMEETANQTTSREANPYRTSAQL